jgi:hypothetical protein
MPACPYCGHVNRAAPLLCEHCGKAILNDDTFMRSMKTAPVPELEAWIGEGATQIEGQQSVLLVVNQATLPVIIKPTGRALILGRVTHESPLQVAINLTPYGGYEQGVSRVHAMLKCANGTLTIEDMSSANGTYVNGHRLVPGQHFLLQDSDEVRLGQLITHVYFR